MANDNIFSGLKVVDLASFIAGPSAAVILSDFGADVIKVEPPAGDAWRRGHQIPPQPQAKDAYPWHLANRNKRGITLDLKSPTAAQVLEKLVKWADVLIVNTPHPARKKLRLEYDDVEQWNPRLIYADLTGFGDISGHMVWVAAILHEDAMQRTIWRPLTIVKNETKLQIGERARAGEIGDEIRLHVTG